MFDVRAHFGKWILVGAMAAAPVGAEVIFEENFDDQPDWHSAMHSSDGTQRATTHLIPEGWYSIRQDPTWAPSEGHPDRHESIEILESNSDKARGGKGKSMVSWRDSYNPGWNRWNSESMMLKYFPEGYDELYVEFWIRFSDEWTRKHVSGVPSATSKLFRISSWNGVPSEYSAFGGGNLGPIVLWDYTVNAYGVRNRVSFRGGPHGDNYDFKDGTIDGLPRKLVGSGDLNMNFRQDLTGMGVDGGDPIIIDRITSKTLDMNSTSAVEHDQIFGAGASWTKVAFYVRLNSKPDVTDGVFRQWINDSQIFNVETIPWIRSVDGREVPAKWNLVAVGGNDFFQIYENELRHEEWYAIDDIVIRSSIPQDLVYKDGTAPPSAPARISVD